jgi:hypothetical protein
MKEESLKGRRERERESRRKIESICRVDLRCLGVAVCTECVGVRGSPCPTPPSHAVIRSSGQQCQGCAQRVAAHTAHSCSISRASHQTHHMDKPVPITPFGVLFSFSSTGSKSKRSCVISTPDTSSKRSSQYETSPSASKSVTFLRAYQ